MPKLKVDNALRRAKAHKRKGEIDQARAVYKEILDAFPSNERARRGLAALEWQKPAIGRGIHPPQEQLDALATLYKQGNLKGVSIRAVSLMKQFPSSFVLWNIVGAASRGLGRLTEAESRFRKAADLNPNFTDAHNNLGNVLKEQGKLEDAIFAYKNALAIKFDDADGHNNLGNVLQENGKLDEAIAAYQNALAIKPDYAAANNNLGNVLKEQGKLSEAISAYQRAIAIEPNYAAAHNNLGVVLQEQCKLPEASAAYQRAIEIKPNYAAAHYGMGIVLQEQGKLDEAIAAYHRAIDIEPNHAEANENLGNTLKKQGKLDEAIAAYQRALVIKPDDAPAEAAMLHNLRKVCDWSNDHQLSEACARLGVTTRAVTPLAMLSLEDDAERQYIRSKKWASEKYVGLPNPFPAKPSFPPERLRIGYFSADLHDHATLYLMNGLLRAHDRKKFEIFAYSYGKIKTGKMRQKAEHDVSYFYDVADLTDAAIVELSHSHAIDVAVDLKGYTQHTRSDLFQYRLAPIQINYLGYPGTMGAAFMDYIIADQTVIPDHQQKFYTEKIIFLPHSYQPNDDTRVIALTKTTRADFGLPDNAFVFCCFNNSYKISAREFNIWMRLLSKIEDGVLWLMKSNIWQEKNLRHEAAARGIDPARLVFADMAQHSEHLARHKHADLFVDTFNYNAHTTTSDALWAGLPVVTKQGQQFAARVAASLLNALGLPELIAENERDYESLILDLASNRDNLLNIRAKLNAKKLTEPLFDTKRYARNFEAGLRQAYDLYFDGAPTRNIWVSEE